MHICIDNNDGQANKTHGKGMRREGWIYVYIYISEGDLCATCRVGAQFTDFHGGQISHTFLDYIRNVMTVFYVKLAMFYIRLSQKHICFNYNVLDIVQV